MKLIHIINSNNKSDFKAAIDELGIQYDYEESIVGKWVHFEIAESDPHWPAVERLVDIHNLGSHTIRSEFTKAEKEKADFLRLFYAWENGYPLPDDDFGYLHMTYNLPEFCKKCDIGKQQKAPFRMKSEPKWGRRHIMKFFWVEDEFFVRPEVWHDVFKPFGIGCRPVVKHRDGEELQTVVQLDIAQTSPSPLCLDGYPTETCEDCGKSKVQPGIQGFFPKFAEPPEGDMFKAQEWFGSGGSAYRPVFISNRLYLALEEKKIKGAVYHPVANE